MFFFTVNRLSLSIQSMFFRPSVPTYDFTHLCSLRKLGPGPFICKSFLLKICRFLCRCQMKVTENPSRDPALWSRDTAPWSRKSLPGPCSVGPNLSLQLFIYGERADGVGVGRRGLEESPFPPRPLLTSPPLYNIHSRPG
jgi:hypothetical protein